jgi:hypothetical protein
LDAYADTGISSEATVRLAAGIRPSEGKRLTPDLFASKTTAQSVLWQH